MKTFLFFALVGFAAAECPNACSGHGTCGAKDACSCYQNYQGNDCSERTCYFGIAHVDTPKGDLNADGYVSGPLTTVVTGSEVYPWGTTEQYPNADEHEGHFYMECSNKGICDRKSGECDCFDGYSGTACARASCPNECSGHGTCESIKELAEMRSYDTNAHHVATTRVAGGTNHQNYNANIEESYSYDLWDQDKTMGCKCDPVYYGADCSLKKCKYGVDPLFYDSTDGVIRQTTVVHLDTTSTSTSLDGNFKIVFYDVFGEKYVTKAIDVAATADAVKLALEALPNGVISKNNHDVTSVQPAAVSVSKHTMGATSTLTTDGCIGAGTEGELGFGLGARNGRGSEYTITFKTNPGVLKTIELDTRQIKNGDSATDYWVANARQGQFESRYSYNIGRINTLKHGSKLLFTNADWTAKVAASELVKVGGQEFAVTAETANVLTLNEPYLGASIEPVLIDTGATAGGGAGLTFGPAVSPAQTADQIVVGSVDNSFKVAALAGGAKLYANKCPFTSTTPNIASSGTALNILEKANGKHDCAGDFLANSVPLYRRSDNPDNQNLYKTNGDVGAVSTSSVILKRGSSKVYFTEVLQDNVAAPNTANQYVKNVGGGGTDDGKFTFNSAAKASPAGALAFVNGFGPFAIPAVAADATDVTATTAADVAAIWTVNTVATGDKVKYPYFLGKAGTDAGVSAGKTVIISGRRYKVKSRTGTDALFTLTESFAGGQLQKICNGCITGYKTDGTGITSNAKLTLAEGSRLLIGSKGREDHLTTLTEAEADDTSLTTSGYTLNAQKANIADHSGADATGQTASLYRLANDERTKIVIVTTEAAASVAKNYQYVAQCSNRGTCDAGTGICKCFKGYSNDNCDTQNMLAA